MLRKSAIAYDAQSRRQSVSYANGATALFGYSARGDIRCHDINLTGTAASACNGAGAEVAYDFTSNGVGQILSESLASTLSGEDLVWRPSFSANDNYASNGLNQYTSVTGTVLSYDGNGNLTNDGRGRSYVFDAENVLRTATVSGTGTSEYRYYADGTRAEKIAPGNLTSQFYYMGGLGYLDAGDTEFAANQEIAEYDGATLLRRYVRLPGSVDEAFLMIDLSLPAGDRERWAHPNRLGSTIVISDSAGAVVDAHTYSPFGQAGEGDGGFPFRFTGQKLDPEAGLYYYKARYYDPELGRFLQTDPIGYADQMNLYAYVANDPVNATDPMGRWGRAASAIGKFAIRTFRYGGNVRRAGRETWAEVRNNAGAVVARDSTAGERLAGAFNMISPISTRDAEAIADWVMNEEAGDVPYPPEVGDQIPGDWGNGEPTADGGWRWARPGGNGDGVRWSPGNSESPYPSSQGPNVKVTSGGRRLTGDGVPSGATRPSHDPDAHIPEEEWVDWDEWDNPGD